MNIYHVYILSQGNSIKLVSTNFLSLYKTLEKYKKKLSLKKMQAYCTLVAKIKKSNILVFETKSETLYFIEKRQVISKSVHISKLSNKPF